MSADVLLITKVPFASSLLASERTTEKVSSQLFQIKENMVNHKKMVHPPCA